MKTLYTELINRLTGEEARKKYLEKDLPPVIFVDFYRGQYLNYDDFEVMALPAILMDFRIDHRDKILSLTLHLCYEQLHDTSSISESLANSLKIFDFIHITNDLIENMETETTGKLQITDEETSRDNTPTFVHLLNYTTKYKGKNKTKWAYTTGENVTIDGHIRYNFD